MTHPIPIPDGPRGRVPIAKIRCQDPIVFFGIQVWLGDYIYLSLMFYCATYELVGLHRCHSRMQTE
jgi:hypothetical protein